MIVLTLWLWVIRRICTPITQLSAAARDIKVGEAIDLLVDGPVEIKGLSECMDKVTKELAYQAGHDPLTDENLLINFQK